MEVQRTCSTTDRHQREKEIVNTLKKNLQNLSNWKFKCRSPENTHPQKRFEGPVESLAKLIGEVLSFMKPVQKEWERCVVVVFF